MLVTISHSYMCSIKYMKHSQTGKTWGKIELESTFEKLNDETHGGKKGIKKIYSGRGKQIKQLEVSTESI